MALTSISKSIGINIRPLVTSVSIVTKGSVPCRQVYSAIENRYTPDYTLAPLTLMPICTAVNPESVLVMNNVNSELTNVKWFEIINGVKKEISTGTDYKITLSGDEKGKIEVNKNSSITTPITLEFRADFVDKRNNHVIRFAKTCILLVLDETAPYDILQLDTSKTVRWNPLRDVNTQKIVARLFVGEDDKTEDPRAHFYWYRITEASGLEEITDGNGENDWEVVSVNKNELVIDRDFIGESQEYVCKAFLDTTLRPEHSLTINDPSTSFVVQRAIPSLHCDIAGVPSGAPIDTDFINPYVIVYDTKGVVKKPDKCLKIKWLVKRAGESIFKVVAEGESAKIAFSKGMLIRVDVEDKGPNALVTVGGSIVISKDGDFVYQKFNV